MRTTILFDFNNLAMRCLHMPRVGMLSGNPSMDFWAYLVFTQIYEFALHIGATTRDIVDIVLAIDGRDGYWRKSYYPLYKADRAERRTEQDELIWKETVSPAIQEFLNLVKKYIPWLVVTASKCEADDVIAVLSKSLVDRNIIIHSSDSDYIQLLSPNIQVYTPTSGYVQLPGEVKVGTSKVYCESVEEFVVLSVMTGQSGKDNVYNIKTPTDWQPTEQQKRKPPFGPVNAKKLWQQVDKNFEKLANYLQENNLQDSYARNEFLINLEMIPGEYCESILKAYDSVLENLPEVNILEFHNHYRWPSLSGVAERSELAEILSLLSGKPIATGSNTMHLDEAAEEIVDLGTNQTESIMQTFTI